MLLRSLFLSALFALSVFGYGPTLSLDSVHDASSFPSSHLPASSWTSLKPLLAVADEVAIAAVSAQGKLRRDQTRFTIEHSETLFSDAVLVDTAFQTMLAANKQQKKNLFAWEYLHRLSDPKTIAATELLIADTMAAGATAGTEQALDRLSSLWSPSVSPRSTELVLPSDLTTTAEDGQLELAREPGGARAAAPAMALLPPINVTGPIELRMPKGADATSLHLPHRIETDHAITSIVSKDASRFTLGNTGRLALAQPADFTADVDPTAQMLNVTVFPPFILTLDSGSTVTAGSRQRVKRGASAQSLMLTSFGGGEGAAQDKDTASSATGAYSFLLPLSDPQVSTLLAQLRQRGAMINAERQQGQSIQRLSVTAAKHFELRVTATEASGMRTEWKVEVLATNGETKVMSLTKLTPFSMIHHPANATRDEIVYLLQRTQESQQKHHNGKFPSM